MLHQISKIRYVFTSPCLLAGPSVLGHEQRRGLDQILPTSCSKNFFQNLMRIIFFLSLSSLNSVLVRQNLVQSSLLSFPTGKTEMTAERIGPNSADELLPELVPDE